MTWPSQTHTLAAMCGIAGIISAEPIEGDRVLSMLRAIPYRGPDNLSIKHYSISTHLHLTIGQVRLAILDPTPDANQPFDIQSGHSLTFNGEFYNFRDVRRELEAGGTQFHTQSDTEVATHLLAGGDIQALNQLEGMFAGVFADPIRRQITLFRDRMGKKPLYMYPTENMVFFASEAKAILAAIDQYPELDQTSIEAFFLLSYIPDDRSAFINMNQLAPGHAMTWHSMEMPSPVRWYHPKPQEPTLEALKPLFLDAVKKRMISDVPLGAFLSGGLDSSLVVAAMAELSEQPVHTFSVRFQGPQALDESPYARLVASHFGTRHEEITLDETELTNLVPLVLNHFDEPFGDSSAVPSFLVSREARRHFTVALSGDGADEVFAGYRKYLGEHYIHKLGPYFLRKWVWRPLANLLPSGRTSGVLERARRMQRLLRGDAPTPAERHVNWMDMSPIPCEQLLQAPFQSGRKRWQSQLVARIPKSATLNDLLRFDQSLVLVHDMFVKVDRMSMKASLEVRSPFVDHRLVEWANSLKPDQKLKGTMRKRVLVEQLGHMLPPQILHRPKSGFEMPIGAWLRTSLKSWAYHQLFEQDDTQEWVYRDHLKRIWQSHQSGRGDFTEPLWYHLVFATWYQRYQRRLLHKVT
ncbi:MAG: asparagine synthase (glutamine-hydrolyzing) [Acidobacteria bacterium]|nr:asparagine synthase (glutamine-hydrolyzing) [Acidobacteriota bacterium]